MLDVGVLLAHHVHVSLQYYWLHIFLPWRGGFLYHYVVNGVRPVFQAEFLGHGDDIFAHCFLVLGTPGYAAQLRKILPQEFRFEFRDVDGHDVSLTLYSGW